jgi:hypothetical protein
MYPCEIPNCPVGCGGATAAALVRTFNPNKTASSVDFEITREDFLRLYAIGREVHIGLSPAEGSYEMDIGFWDLDNPQVWEMPDIPFLGPSVWTITDPSETPHASLFPEATHVLVTTNYQLTPGTVYEYYNIAETAVIMLGRVVEPPNEAPLETERFDLTLALFPLNESLGVYQEAEVDYDGLQVLRLQAVEMLGFGTFAYDAQDIVNAGTFIDDIVFSNLDAVDPYDPDEIITFETRYSIFGEDGSWFSFYVDDPPEGDSTAIMGDIYAHFVESWRVVDATSTAIEDETPPETPTWSVYPNPATDVIQFSEPTSVALYDVLGREVGKGTSVQHLDVSQLTPGLYLVRSEAGESKTLIIR